MADALASGASARKGVGVQVPPRARIEIPGENRGFFFAATQLFSPLCLLGAYWENGLNPLDWSGSHIRSHLHG